MPSIGERPGTVVHAVARLISWKHHLDHLHLREALNHHPPATRQGEIYLTSHSKAATVPSNSSRNHHTSSQAKVTPAKLAYQWPMASSTPALEWEKAKWDTLNPSLYLSHRWAPRPAMPWEQWPSIAVCLQLRHKASTSKPKCPSFLG